jgi:hypothetical protein
LLTFCEMETLISSMNTKEFIESLCAGENLVEYPAPIEATLILDNQPPSIGLFSLQSRLCGQGSFQPNDGNILDTHSLKRGILKLKDRTESMRISHCRPCSMPHPDHYHFDFEILAAS